MTFCFIRHETAPKRFSHSIRILFSMVTSFSPGSESLLYRMAFFIWIIEFSRICFTKLKYEIRIAKYHLTSLSLSLPLFSGGDVRLFDGQQQKYTIFAIRSTVQYQWISATEWYN